jgi:hypothetical protein
MAGSRRVKRGELYEDYRYHPMLCIKPAQEDDDVLIGVTLINGMTSSCSEAHCGVVPLTVEDAIDRKVHWNAFAEMRGLPNPFPRDGWASNEVG